MTVDWHNSSAMAVLSSCPTTRTRFCPARRHGTPQRPTPQGRQRQRRPPCPHLLGTAELISRIPKYPPRIPKYPPLSLQRHTTTLSTPFSPCKDQHPKTILQRTNFRPPRAHLQTTAIHGHPPTYPQAQLRPSQVLPHTTPHPYLFLHTLYRSG